MEERWLEVRFYFLCMTVMQKTANVETVLNFMEALSFLNNYKIESIKKLAYRCLTDPNFQPSRNEYVVLAHINGVHVRKILKQLEMHPKTFYAVINKNNTDPMKFYPRLSNTEHDIIKALMETLEFLKEL